MTNDTTATRYLDARLHLLDRQLVDHDGDPVGIVDDLELDGVEPDRDIEAGAPAPTVAALLSGHVFATRVFGGSPPRSRYTEFPWRLVAKVGVTVCLHDTDQPAEGHWVEHWLRRRIIAHIPGGRHATQ
ncbi:hypothetical protein V4U86_20685 [Mycobacterium sp. AMU20-3851]|uniref:PRC-barrel domain-containing protein n=1 Tax=Mycobacterium sp. AMU20-3851 TaxID=3122055 RepID=UPI00375442AC